MGLEELLRTVREFAEKQQAAGQGGWQSGVLKAVADMAQPAEAVARDIRMGEPPAVEDIASTTLNIGGMLPGAKSIGLAGSLIGAGARSWRPSMEKLATQMRLGGASWDQILKETGLSWSLADGKWRGEISDVGARLSDEAMNAADRVFGGKQARQTVPMSRVLENSQFADLYPERFAKSEVTFVPGKTSGAKYMLKDPEHTVLDIGTESWKNPGQRASISQLMDSFFHENTHGTQVNEGFATGSWPQAPDVLREAAKLGWTPGKVYRHVPGEAEARNFGEFRRDLEESVLRQIHPTSTLDVPYRDILWHLKGERG